MFKDFRSISSSLFMGFWETKLIEHPVTEFRFTLTAQYEGKVATKRVSTNFIKTSGVVGT